MNAKTHARIQRILKLLPGGLYQMSVSFELESILREQDRDTRQACAEIVAALGGTEGMSVSDVSGIASRACMNVQAL